MAKREGVIYAELSGVARRAASMVGRLRMRTSSSALAATQFTAHATWRIIATLRKIEVMCTAGSLWCCSILHCVIAVRATLTRIKGLLMAREVECIGRGKARTP